MWRRCWKIWGLVGSGSRTLHLGKKLWEMRMRGKGGIARAIYFAAMGKRLIVVRAFVKKTQKTPRGEIEIATNRIRDL